MKSPKAKLVSYLEALRFPWLLLITVTLFVINVLVPDVVPFLDEILLALAAVILARVKRKPAKNASEGDSGPE